MTERDIERLTKVSHSRRRRYLTEVLSLFVFSGSRKVGRFLGLTRD
jgi:hypothetical protein